MDIIYKFLLPSYLAEFFAAIIGLYFLLKKRLDIPTQLFVGLLWIVILVESYGLITCFAYYSDYKLFGFLEGTFFAKNGWIFDHSGLLFDAYISYYFSCYISNKRIKRLIQVLAVMLFVFSELWQFDIIFSNRTDSPFSNVFGAVLMVISAMLLFLEIAKSELILKVSHFFPFYLAVGIVVFTLCTTPIFIYFGYHNFQNEFFVNFRLWVFLVVNLFLYSLISIGFIVCYRKRSLD